MPTLSDSGMSRRYAVIRRGFMLAGRVLLGFRLHGEENVPAKGALVVASNHWRFFDPIFVCMAVPRRVQWMAKKELFLKPLVGFFGLLGAFPVDRQGGGRGALRVALSYLKEGWALGIFPEGTRRRGDQRKYGEGDDGGAKSGAVMLAARSGAVIVPVFIGEIPGPVARLRGATFDAYVGEPISTGDDLRGREAYRGISDEMMRGIYSLPNKPRHDSENTDTEDGS